MVSTIRAYWMPLIMLSAAIFYQLVVIPMSFPPSHYDALGIPRYSSIQDVEQAYHKLSSKWESGSDSSSTVDFIKIQYAYELLTNPLWKRNYDIFGIDEQLHVIAELKGKYAGESFSSIDIPLLDVDPSDPGDQAVNGISSKDSQDVLKDMSMPWLIQVYSFGSRSCAQFSHVWKRIASLLEGVANTGAVELGNVQLATYLADKKPTGKPFFRGLPALVGFPRDCKMPDCVVRFEGELSVDAVTDWFVTTVLGLPRIIYYSKESLGPKFLAKSSPHKVKVIFFSKTGERATPFIRQAAKDYSAYASFAYVLWQEGESSFWWNTFEVETPPAVVFMKDPGVKPVVHYGAVNSSWFLHIMEQNKQQELPQLRALTSRELGCDARGYSRAGHDTMTWYCVILAGRLSLELNKMRDTMRRVQETLLKDTEVYSADDDQSVAPSALALKNKRLTFAWLDGEAQKKYCQFYLSSETSYETCGSRSYFTDVPRLFIIRYKRNATEDDKKEERRPRSVLTALLQDEDVDPAAQLVAKYNGSEEVSEIIPWISKIIEDGDSRDLPFFRSKTPELVPEGEDILSRSALNIISKSKGIKGKIQRIVTDHLGDPRIGPALFLGALLSLGTIWLQRNQSTSPSQPNQLSQPATTDGSSGPRRRARSAPVKDLPPSITDEEPKDAYQMPLSGSDSE